MAKNIVNRREPEETDWMTHHEVAKLFGVQPRTVYSWIRTQKPNPHAPVASDEEQLAQDLGKIPYRRSFKGLGRTGQGQPVIHFPRQAIYDLLDSKSKVGRPELFEQGRQVRNLRCVRCKQPVQGTDFASHNEDVHNPFKCKACGVQVEGRIAAMQHKAEEHPE